MVKHTFTVQALWDDEVGVYYSESDIIGLHIEAATIDEFEKIMMEVAPELIIENHLSAPILANMPLRDLVPTILWQRPAARTAA